MNHPFTEQIMEEKYMQFQHCLCFMCVHYNIQTTVDLQMHKTLLHFVTEQQYNILLIYDSNNLSSFRDVSMYFHACVALQASQHNTI